MTEYTAIAVRAKTEDRVLARIEVTDLEIPAPVFPTDVSPAGETLRGENALVREIQDQGHAVPVGRTLDDLDAGLLARVYTLSERGVAHLFAESGGIVLATTGSTVGDRRHAVERLPEAPDRRFASRRMFGVLVEAGVGEHHSEREGWGPARNPGRDTLGKELEFAAERYRAARAGSLAVADTKAERRRIEANRERLRAEFVARRRRGEELAVRCACEIDAAREAGREFHWTEAGDLKRRAERARRSGRAAYDTARAVYLQRLPTLAHRLLHLLRREGRTVREREFVSRHAKLAGAKAVEPGSVVRAALRELAGAGKVRRLRSRGTGEVFLAAIEPLDERDFRRTLNGLIRDERFGIVSPWVEPGGAVPEGEEDEETLLSGDHEVVYPEETGCQALLDNVADESAQEEIEALTA